MSSYKILPITSVLFASGEGSRLKDLSFQLGVPKHLFPLGNSTVCGRTLRQLLEFSSQVMIICKREHYELFLFYLEKENLHSKVELYIKNHKGFKGDFEVLKTKARYSHSLISVGDLVFEDRELMAHYNDYKKNIESSNDTSLLSIDRVRLKRCDFRINFALLHSSLMDEVAQINPESISSVAKLFLRHLFKGKISLNLSFAPYNINTPQAYKDAQNGIANQITQH